jgi:hypothetical protein
MSSLTGMTMRSGLETRSPCFNTDPSMMATSRGHPPIDDIALKLPVGQILLAAAARPITDLSRIF